MKTNTNGYRGYRFPPEIISHGVWLYHRFCLSFRDVEEILAKRGIIVTYETVRPGASCPPWITTRDAMLTTGLKSRINPLDNENVKCEGGAAFACGDARSATQQISWTSAAVTGA